MGDFRKLKVWQRSKSLAVHIYKQTEKGKFARDYSFRDQICRAVVSISSNIAEGDELGTNKQAVRFFYIAKGSSAEVLSQAIIALEIGYLDNDSFNYIEKECRVISGIFSNCSSCPCMIVYQSFATVSSCF